MHRLSFYLRSRPSDEDIYFAVDACIGDQNHFFINYNKYNVTYQHGFAVKTLLPLSSRQFAHSIAKILNQSVMFDPPEEEWICGYNWIVTPINGQLTEKIIEAFDD